MSEVNEAITEPEAEAHGSDNAPAVSPLSVSPLSVPPLELQPVAAAHEPAAHYQLAELVRYHDRAFVAHAYAALCRRAPTDAELAHTLDDLRAGRRSKVEIIESLCAGAPAVQVVGLPSPLLRRIDRWPVLGYVLRLLRAVVHLPVSLQQQQQFEIYALAQQQRIADYLNEAFAELAAHAVETAERSAELTARATALATSSAELTARVAAVQAELERFQEQQRQVQMQLHADIVAVSGQREFLVQEQRVIVETQRVVLGELQAQLHELAAQHEQQHAELTTQVRRLQTRAAATTTGELPPASAPERGQA